MKGRIFLGVAFIVVAGIVFYIGSQLSKSGGVMSNSAKPEDMVQDSLSLEGVNELVSEGICDVTIFKSDKNMMIVSYDAAHSTNHSKVNGNKLSIHFGMDQVGFFDFTIRPDVKIQIFTDSINSIVNRGTGHITSNDTFMFDEIYLSNEGIGSMEYTVSADNVIARNRGAGSLDIYGNSAKLDLVNEGIGSINTTQLDAQHVKARNSGVGSIRVVGTDSLHLTNDGIGSLQYSGTGEVYYERNDGIGSISQN